MSVSRSNALMREIELFRNTTLILHPNVIRARKYPEMSFGVMNEAATSAEHKRAHT